MFVLFVLFFGHFLKQCALRPITFFLWVNISLLKKKIINTEEKKIQKKIKKSQDICFKYWCSFQAVNVALQRPAWQTCNFYELS